MSRPGIDRVFERHLSALVNGGEPQILQGGRKGVEKESLRVLPHGRLAATPHPPLLGSALTSEHITTDYSEALDRKSTRLNSSHGYISYAVFCLKKKTKTTVNDRCS